MASKSNFTPEEWKTLLESAMMAGIAVTAADPSGLWGTLKESMASARTIMGATHNASSTEFMKAVAGEYETAEGRAIAREGLRAELNCDQSSGSRQAGSSLSRCKGSSGCSFLQSLAAAYRPSRSRGVERRGFFRFWRRDTEKATLAHIAESLGLPA
jgi:hypothetical protein